MALAYVSGSAAFGSLLPWMTQVGRSAIDERQAPSASKDAPPWDAPPPDELALTALRVSERLLRQFFDESPIGVAVFDPAGTLLHFNRAFRAMVGYAAEDLRERNIDELLCPDDVPSIQERRRLLLEGRCDDFQLELRFGAGCRRQVWTRMCGRMERHHDDRPPHIFTHIVDLTEFEPMVKNTRRHSAEARWKNWDCDRYM